MDMKFFFKGLRNMKKLVLTPSFQNVCSFFPFGYFDSLEEIDIQNCNLNSLPMGFTKIPNPEKVKNFQFKGNNFQGLSLHLANSFSTFNALVSALKELEEGKEEKCRTVKLLVVGDAAVGKTTLISKLQGKNTKQIKTLATDGIDLGELILNDIHLTCWDFAGQVLILFYSN